MVAHEYTHAVIQHSSNLNYNFEPGALNESFADIFGASVEFFSQQQGPGKGKFDWSIGEDFWTPQNGDDADALRYMDKPWATTGGNLGDFKQPSWYRGTNWCFFCDPATDPKCVPDGCDAAEVNTHINSGVQNHFYYILSVGKTNYMNDGHGPFTVSGISERYARELAYDVMVYRANSSTNYKQIRNLWIASANEKYPNHPNYAISVMNAWSAVGVCASISIPTGLIGQSESYTCYDPCNKEYYVCYSIHLSWNANTENDIAYYKIYETDKFGESYSYIGNSYTTSFYVGDVQPNRAYYYSIRAVNKCGTESNLTSKVRVYVSPSTAIVVQVGKKTPSPYLVSRDGFGQIPSESCVSSFDYGEELIYRIDNLDKSKVYELTLIYPPDTTEIKRIESFYVDDFSVHSHYTLTDTTTQIRKILPKSAYLNDGEVLLKVIKELGDNAVISEIILIEVNSKSRGTVPNQQVNESISNNIIPNTYELSQNYPNPFNSQTAIKFSIPTEGETTLRIYNINGELVRTLFDETKGSGFYTVNWNGFDDKGGLVSSGVYIYILKSGRYSALRKMVFIR